MHHRQVRSICRHDACIVCGYSESAQTSKEVKPSSALQCGYINKDQWSTANVGKSLSIIALSINLSGQGGAAHPHSCRVGHWLGASPEVSCCLCCHPEVGLEAVTDSSQRHPALSMPCATGMHPHSRNVCVLVPEAHGHDVGLGVVVRVAPAHGVGVRAHIAAAACIPSIAEVREDDAPV